MPEFVLPLKEPSDGGVWVDVPAMVEWAGVDGDVVVRYEVANRVRSADVMFRPAGARDPDRNYGVVRVVMLRGDDGSVSGKVVVGAGTRMGRETVVFGVLVIAAAQVEAMWTEAPTW